MILNIQDTHIRITISELVMTINMIKRLFNHKQQEEQALICVYHLPTPSSPPLHPTSATKEIEGLTNEVK